MSFLYLWINMAAVLIPLIFSFHPKLRFYKKWRSLFPAILIMMMFFISWDVYFTAHSIWGFNDEYLLGIKLLNLPIEEWMFFICIPYACLFTHYSLPVLLPKTSLTVKSTSRLFFLVIGVLIIVLFFAFDKLYTLINFAFAIILLLWVYFNKRKLLNSFFVSFLIILIPFFLVNGILTGTGIDSPIVWYNNSENLGIRIGSIPIEDIVYAFGMLLLVLTLVEIIEDKFEKKTHFNPHKKI